VPTTPTIPTSAEEDYLKAIFALGGRGRRVQTTELARHLGVRKPSVTSMLKRLSGGGMVDYSPRQGAQLLEPGRLATMRVLRRHRLIETFLVEVLHLDWSEVHVEAEVLEHHLSDRMVAAIDEVLDQPGEDPHGRPIPDSDGGLRVRDLVPLAALGEGERGTVREVRAGEAGRLQRWKELGLVPGARLHMRQRQELEDVMHIGTDAETVITGSEGVEGVFVEKDE